MTNRKWTLFLVMAIALALGAGCVYRAPIAQGNLVKEDDLAQLEVGMTKNQVRFLLGTPMIDDPFNSQRWDYVYYLKIGRREAVAERWVSVFFEDDSVVEIRRDQELRPGL